MRKYYGMVKCIDDNVGEILDTLRELELLEDTIVVFTSDHGDLCGEHGRLNKGVPYEGSARIPFLMYCNGKISPKTDVHEALSCIDFVPTVMNLLDVEVRHKVDGRDASPLFTGDSSGWDDVAILRSTSGKTSWLSAVTQDLKLVFSTVESPWLIDLKNDPNEVVNEFENPKYAEKLQKLTSKLHTYAQEHNDPYARTPRIRRAINRILN